MGSRTLWIPPSLLIVLSVLAGPTANGATTGAAPVPASAPVPATAPSPSRDEQRLADLIRAAEVHETLVQDDLALTMAAEALKHDPGNARAVAVRSRLLP